MFQRKSYIWILLITFILLAGCAKEEKYNFVINYQNSEGETYAYNQYGQIFQIFNGNATKVEKGGLYLRPAILYQEVHEPYSLQYNLPGNYKCTTTEAFAYVTNLIDNGYYIVSYESDPNMCSMQLFSDYDRYRILITNNVTRIYVQDYNGNPGEPQLLSSDDKYITPDYSQVLSSNSVLTPVYNVTSSEPPEGFYAEVSENGIEVSMNEVTEAEEAEEVEEE